MSLIPWKPLFDLDDLFKEEEDWFLPVLSRKEIMKPAMDIYETDKDIVAEVNVPDFDPKNIEVSVEDGVLKVSGKMKEKKEEKKKGYWKKEIKRGSFERMIKLPTPVKEKKIEAAYEDGILKIVMPKEKAKPSSKVKIKIKKSK